MLLSHVRSVKLHVLLPRQLLADNLQGFSLCPLFSRRALTLTCSPTREDFFHHKAISSRPDTADPVHALSVMCLTGGFDSEASIALPWKGHPKAGFEE